MKQVNFGALVRLTLLATLLGTASYAQDMESSATDEAQVEQSAGDDGYADTGLDDTVSDETTVDETNVDETTQDETTVDEITGDEGGPDIVIDDGDIMTMLPVDDSGMVPVDPPIVIDDFGVFCDDNVCWAVDPVWPVDEEIVVTEGEDWIKEVDEPSFGDCGGEVCALDDTSGGGDVIETPEVVISPVEFGEPAPSIDGGLDPRVLQMSSSGATDDTAPTLQAKVESSSNQVLERSASADGRVLCLSVPKAERDGRGAFELCQP